MRTVDGYLSRRAQRLLDRTAIVTHEDERDWRLERDGHEALGLGDSFGDARQSLDALTQREATRRGED